MFNPGALRFILALRTVLPVIAETLFNWIKQLSKAKVAVSSVAAATAKFLFGMCNCKVYRNTRTGDFSLVLGILHVCDRTCLWAWNAADHIDATVRTDPSEPSTS